MKMNANRGKIEQLIREIDQYQSRASTAHSKDIQISEEVRMPEAVLDGLNIRLSKLYKKIRTQEGRLETIQPECDLSCRQLEVAVADNSPLQPKPFGVLSHCPGPPASPEGVPIASSARPHRFQDPGLHLSASISVVRRVNAIELDLKSLANRFCFIMSRSAWLTKCIERCILLQG
jgi:hypothetical protein